MRWQLRADQLALYCRAMPNDLNFEKNARSDFRVWLSFAVGLFLFTPCLFEFSSQTTIFESPAPIWLTAILFISGLGFMLFAGIALLANTSRGCKIDPETGELIWWQMKFPKQGLSQKYRISISSIESIRIDSRGDDVDVALFDKGGQKHPLFSENSLPSNYNLWADNLCRRFPHIRIER